VFALWEERNDANNTSKKVLIEVRVEVLQRANMKVGWKPEPGRRADKRRSAIPTP